MVSLKEIAPSGANAGNAKWEAGESDKMYIELQRFCADLVEVGVATKNEDLIEKGLLLIEWAFRQQAEEGGFPKTADPFHSTSLFVDGAATALVLLREQGDPRYAAEIERYTPKLLKAARWLTQPEVEKKGRKTNAPYTHRFYVLAQALGETAFLAGDEALAKAAAGYAREGLSRQTDEGINPEKDGYDVSYQMVGILHAEHYLTTLSCDRDRALCDGIKRMIAKGLDWEMDRLKPDGELDIGDSTRLRGKGSKSRSGKPKHVNYKEVIEAFVYGFEITGEARYREAAERAARHMKWAR